jgi:septal ring factor EnvC (AmiA/AmiB activator)
MIRLAVLFVWVSTAVIAQQSAQLAAQQLADASRQLQEADRASDRIAALTQVVQAYEAGLSALRAGQREIAVQELALSADFADQQDKIAQLLGVLTTISRTPQPVQRIHPQGPIAALRAGMLVADMSAALEIKTSSLQALLLEAQTIRAAQENAAQTLASGLQGAQTARAALGQAMSERTELPTRFQDDPVQTALLVASATTLGDFAASVAEARPDGPGELRAQGNLPLPVDGQVLPDDDSGRGGIVISAVPRALITAPAPATILFQGELLEYGNVVILEPATDVLFIMAGFAEVFGEAGEVVAAGAPLGLLAAAIKDDDENLTQNDRIGTGIRAQSLYLEVRDGQAVVNADAWFALE